jgi:ABC-type nitrate/sulfonate/bicarbonate transport system permease component
MTASRSSVQRLLWKTRSWRDGAIGFVVLFAGWELVARLAKIPRYILPPPSSIWADFMARYPRMLDAAATTGARS